jgi:hypothetical protein
MKLTQSPWGPVQDQEQLADGIVQVHTAGHGGIWLSPERQAALPDWARCVSSGYCAKPTWWEEDCEAAVPMYVFFDEMPEWVQKHGKAKLREWIVAWHKLDVAA